MSSRALDAQIADDVHGYLIEGWWDEIGPMLERAVATKLDVSLHGNPDVVRVISDGVGVEEARFISMLQSRKGIGKKIFFLAFRSMTTEAQNALLKVFEEPTLDTYFFVVVPSATTIVATLQSRLRRVTDVRAAREDALVASFLTASPAKRLTLLADMVTTKDKGAAHGFLDDLLSTLYDKKDMHNYRALEQIINARRYLPDRGSSVKLLLEHIALVVPVQ